MSKTFEDGLRQLVFSAGNLLEKLIGQAKNARKQVDISRGLKPVFSLESYLSQDKIRELISSASDKLITPSLPDLKDMDALEIASGTSPFTAQLVERKASSTIFLDLKTGHKREARRFGRANYQTVQGLAHRLPFAKASFDFALANLATPEQGDIASAISELGRVMKDAGRGLLVDYHPYGLYAQKGSNRLRPASTLIRGVEDYYRLFKRAQMRIVDLREAWIDESLRPLFSEEEIQAYRALKGTPLIVFLYFFKVKAKGL